ncbi:cell death regulator Aven-like [Saccoglossus kowalevskii]|uniref:Cell death regulator Aven-like n=1 Tax=Saccoglossus kowalevskii TaxID=10224 RepID=A0ABM0M712_SACKO|nr:PREDICTED: cell death regulator Aven-like [Saccoglossus kowalevskii]
MTIVKSPPGLGYIGYDYSQIIPWARIYLEYYRKFSRRKVESNWDRYEGLPDDEEEAIQMRGSDFSILINQAGTASSQFCFQDEKEWKEEMKSIQIANNVLSLDVDALSSSLNTIPLHKILQIEEDIFQPTTIRKFEEKAAENKKLLLGKTVPSLKTTSVTGRDRDPTQSEICTERKPTAATPHIAVLSEDLKQKIRCDIERTVKPDREITHHAEEKPWQQEEEDDKAEDELNFLLSLETPVSQTVMPNEDSSQLEIPDTQIKDDGSKAVAEKTFQPNKESTEESSVDIEDWLDSVLDD